MMSLYRHITAVAQPTEHVDT